MKSIRLCRFGICNLPLKCISWSFVYHHYEQICTLNYTSSISHATELLDMNRTRLKNVYWHNLKEDIRQTIRTSVTWERYTTII